MTQFLQTLLRTTATGALSGVLAATAVAQTTESAPAVRLADQTWNLDTIVHAGILSPDLTNPDPTLDAYYGEANLNLKAGDDASLHLLLDLRAQTIAAGESEARRSRASLLARPGIGLKIPLQSNFRLFGQVKQAWRWNWVRQKTGRDPIESTDYLMYEAGVTDWYRGAYWTAGLAHNEGEPALGRSPWQFMGYVHVDDRTDALSWGVNGRGSTDMLEFGLSLRFF